MYKIKKSQLCHKRDIWIRPDYILRFFRVIRMWRCWSTASRWRGRRYPPTRTSHHWTGIATGTCWPRAATTASRGSGQRRASWREPWASTKEIYHGNIISALFADFLSTCFRRFSLGSKSFLSSLSVCFFPSLNLSFSVSSLSIYLSLFSHRSCPMSLSEKAIKVGFLFVVRLKRCFSMKYFVRL